MAMNRRVLESSPVQHLTVPGNPNWWNNINGSLRPSPPLMSQQPPQPNFFSSDSVLAHPSSNPNFSSWLANCDLPLDQPWSLSQLLLGGLMMGEEEKMEMMYNTHNHNQQHSHQRNKLEHWEEEVLRSMKQESDTNNGYVSSSPPNKSCVTIHNNINHEDDNKNIHNGLNLSKCISSEIIGSNKKPKLQVTSSQSSDLIKVLTIGLIPLLAVSVVKVKKEKLRGRIASLHQIVSPFGKTDTASVLSEAIGYIRFLHSQIEALSLPYFGTIGTNNVMHQNAQGFRSGIFPEDPGQLMNEDVMIRSKGDSLSTTDNHESKTTEEANKDLRSKGLCLVPISYILEVGNDNGADYWAPTFGFAFQ